MIERPQIEKPQTFNGDLANLPAALAPLCLQPRWVVWSWEWRKTKTSGKWTKPPRQARDPSRYAKSNDPSTWGSYADAVGAVAAGKADGIGYMLSTSDIAAGDLDHCRDPETGMVDPWAETLHTEANGAYREVTVSGRGLRVIGITTSGRETHTKFTFDRKTGAGLELYRNTARYITISGREIGSCAELSPLDGFIDAMLARYAGKKRHTESNSDETRTPHGFDFNDAGPQSSIDYDEVIRNGAPNGQRSELFQACVWHLAAKGMSVEEIVAAFEQYPHGIGEKYAGRLRAEVERSFAKWQADRQPRPAADVEEPEEATGWDETDKHGRPKPTCPNARRAIKALGIRCRYDVFHDRYLVESPLLRGDSTVDQKVLVIRSKIHKAFGFDPGTTNTFDAVVQVCLDNKFDPVLDYLDTLAWDGVPRLDRWLVTYAGAEDTAQCSLRSEGD